MLKYIKRRINLSIVFLIAFCCMLSTLYVAAATDAIVTQCYADEKEVNLFVDGIYDEIEQIGGYIGSEGITEIEWKKIKESDTEIKTLVLMDTSLSIKSEVKEHFKTMLRIMVENMLPNERIAIATYGKTPTYLCDYQSDTELLVQVIENISYKKQSSYLYQSIYDIVLDFNRLNDKCLKRIVIFSDGDDTNSVGVSKTEVLTLLDKTRYPIYTIGCQSDTNADSLKDFFALSRITGAKSLQFSKEITQEEMKAFGSTIEEYWGIKIVPSEHMMDGGVKNITLNISTVSDVYNITADVRMGRAVLTENEKAEDVTETEENEQDVIVTKPVATKIPEVEPVEVTESEQVEVRKLVKLLGGIVLVLALIALAGYFLLKKSREQKRKKKITPQSMPLDEAVQPGYGLRVVLEDRMNGQNILVPLYAYPEGRFVSIGRNREKSDVTVDYDNGISQVHCVIYLTDDEIYVEDCQSTNHTYLNGNQVIEPERISEGDILTLGKVKFSVHIVQS